MSAFLDNNKFSENSGTGNMDSGEFSQFDGKGRYPWRTVTGYEWELGANP